MGPKRVRGGHEDEVQQNRKRQRGPNFTSLEDDLLADLVLKHRNILENKRTDAISTAQKTEGWHNLAEEFNSVSSNKRDWSCLRSHYLNLKITHKKVAAGDKVNRFLTGGGTATPTLSSVGEKILALVGDTVQPLLNPYDSDAFYNCEISDTVSVSPGSNRDQENIGHHEIYGSLENYGVLVPVGGSVPIFNNTMVGNGTTSTSSALASTTLDGVGTEPNSTPNPNVDKSAQNTNVNGSTPKPSTSNAGKQWKNCWEARRRPMFTRTSTIESKITAAKNIASLALAKKEYYEEMMELSAVEAGHRIGVAEAEHAKKMEVLETKRKYYEFKMSKKN